MAAKTDQRVPPNGTIETIQSLVVAFVVAMAFRGFVVEGYVIPTGSMAPTLNGRHYQITADATGFTYNVGTNEQAQPAYLQQVVQNAADPMLGVRLNGTAIGSNQGAISPVRMGDRVLVIKPPFSRPQRFDVTVFKNPTSPIGSKANYIKRLIGLPGEAIWLVDGDVFVATADEGRAGALDAFTVRRKPEYIQRAVWQPVHNSDYIPTTAAARDRVRMRPGPWLGDGWDTESRAYRCDRDDRSVLEWENRAIEVQDWAPYNSFGFSSRGPQTAWTDPGAVYVNDFRVTTTVEPDDDGLDLTFEIDARGHAFEFRIANGQASMRWRSSAYGEDFPDQGWTAAGPVGVDAFTPGDPTRLEFWFVDQALWLFVDGERVLYEELDWNAVKRLEHASETLDDPRALIEEGYAELKAPEFRFLTSGTPLTMSRVTVDRDLHYRAGQLGASAEFNPTLPEYASIVAKGQWSFGSHPDNLAILGDDHFFMLGDNSRASLDSRLWGNPHPMMAVQVDDHPFLVHRCLLLGKAWVVYFPAPRGITAKGKAILPDFGKLRFIR